MSEIKPIAIALPFGLGHVNCYLIKTEAGYLLIDTGASNQRTALDKELQAAGCQPGNLKLIILTHGDFDHTGNAAYLRQKFQAPLAMHPDDFGMIERGDMFANRSSGNPILKTLAPVMFRFGQSNWVTPDLQLTEEFDLAAYGLDAKVISLPGHSRGSIGILTSEGDLFCGDLLENTKRPALNSIMDDRVAAQASVEKLRNLKVKIIYPGHGQAFALEQLPRNL
ncbi:MAG TPA: MBL fold metallo-hydrolase [Anaerolineae bacterium]|nr:MBL fold metallo-hydrolase [Anaerolineae bacterium]